MLRDGELGSRALAGSPVGSCTYERTSNVLMLGTMYEGMYEGLTRPIILFSSTWSYCGTLYVVRQLGPFLFDVRLHASGNEHEP